MKQEQQAQDFISTNKKCETIAFFRICVLMFFWPQADLKEIRFYLCHKETDCVIRIKIHKGT
jgi:hypothetical protein